MRRRRQHRPLFGRTGPVWTKADGEAVKGEGWNLFRRSDGTGLEIERDDEAGVFDTDDEAVAFVRHRAAEGSERHGRALEIDRQTHTPVEP